MDLTQYQPSEINALPQKPGIYFFYDAKDVVLYVGKAKRLKSRVSQYFQNKTTSQRLYHLVSQIHTIKIMLTESESDALILENRMIKKHKPKYNVLLKDDKTYPYVCLTNHTYPRIVITRHNDKKGGQYFGPYTNGAHVRRVMDMLQKLFKLRTCTNHFFEHRSRPCLLYQINRCSGPCVKKVSKDDYARTVQEATQLLSGNAQSVINHYVAIMHAHSEAMAFEKAAEYRDMIQTMQAFLHDSTPVRSRKSLDLIFCELLAHGFLVQLTCYRDSEVESRKDFYFPDVSGFMQELLAQFFLQYYQSAQPIHHPDTVLIHVDQPLDLSQESSMMQEKGFGARLKYKPTTVDERSFVKAAQLNFDCAVERYTNQACYYTPAFDKLAQAFSDANWENIDCVDISHLQGQHTTAACVRFSVSGPVKSAFRSYNLDTGNDDYASMRSFVERRFMSKNQSLQKPNCLLIDGGRGQLSSVHKALQGLDVQDIHLLAICKAPGRKSGQERYFALTLEHGVQQLQFDDDVSRMLENIRDHAHRFAITRQRKKHLKSSLSSSLECIEGLGPKRIKNLLHHLGGMQSIQEASVKQLHQVPGISYELAVRIHDFLHKTS